MKPAAPVVGTPAEAEEQLKGFVAKFEPAHQTLIRAVRKKLRQRFPTAYELAYDNDNFFVIGYGPTERPSECILSMAAGANGVGRGSDEAGAQAEYRRLPRSVDRAYHANIIRGRSDRVVYE